MLSPAAGDGPEEVWDDGSASNLVSLPVSHQVGAWLFSGRLLSGATGLGTLSYDLDRLKDGSMSRLCELLGPHPRTCGSHPAGLARRPLGRGHATALPGPRLRRPRQGGR
ncbi:hypothetical protein GCM10010372_17710 [Streptomyces tauricus]|uniref:hypothetical protein n=1 Tax=Streptomyces tauricus TaxID=68274 RepID=UPI001672B08B|nr:hypothetical protein [Streptomyces tauricus]GHA18342.1 hypothetical protein GCM10010372_17710 [Streptomyces tauricus]